MAWHGRLLTKIAALTVVWLACDPAMASTFRSKSKASTSFGKLPVEFSDGMFQIGGGGSSSDAGAFGSRDSSICGPCSNIHTASLFEQTGKLQKEINGIGAGSLGLKVPAGITILELLDGLSDAGLRDRDEHRPRFDDLSISSDEPTVAATPIPSTLPLLATGLAGLGLLSWHRRRKAAAAFGLDQGRKLQPQPPMAVG
jgi:hypothetical protein